MGGELMLPGGLSTRAKLISDINAAFGRSNISATAEKLLDLAATGDFLDMCYRLGFLDSMHGGNLQRYKDSLTIPPGNRTLITAAFRLSLTAKLPLQILIVSGSHELVSVTATSSEIWIAVARDELTARAPRKRSAPRKGRAR
jgi:hypothetical protein